MSRFAVCACALGLAIGCGGDDPPAGPMAYEVSHYDYAFDLETRAATAAVTLRVTEPGDCLSIAFRPDAITEVLLDEKPVREGAIDGDLLTVCGRGWEAGEEIVLQGALTVPDEAWEPSQVGYSVTDDLEGNPFTYLVSWVGGCDRFGPCDAAPARFATYRFEITHPAGTRALCPGRVTHADTVTTCEFDHAGGPTYSGFGFAASPSWVETDLGTWDGVRVSLWDMPSTGIGDRLRPEIHEGFLTWMADTFGPYPYGDELRLVVGPTYWSGFEHPGNIVLFDRLGLGMSSYSDALAHTVNHEIAHQWAGDQATLADTYDFVWKEAMAEYLTFVYEDEALAETVGPRTARAWKAFSRSAAYYPVPAERPPLLDYYGDVYGPGPMILFRQLEALYSRDAIIAALQSLLGQPRALSIDDVQAALEAETGADLTAYFDAWVHGEGAPTWPTVDVEVADNSDGSYTVTVAQAVAGDTYYGAAFALQLEGDAGETHEVWIDFGVDGSASVTETATPTFPVTDHTVDPHGHSLIRETTPTLAPPPRINPWVATP